MRAATERDLPFMVELGRIMHGKTGFDVPYEPEGAESLGRMILSDGACFLTERGMIGGLETPLIYGKTPCFSTVVFWYSEDGTAWKLLNKFKKWARLPVAVSTYDPRMKRILERKGASQVEGVMAWPVQ